MNNHWPTQAEVLKGASVYGNPRGLGGASASRRWEDQNLRKMAVPWPMRMGTIKITSFRMHKHCAPSLMRVFDTLLRVSKRNVETLEKWGVTKFGGGFNYRLMRGGDKLSMHSYGCAIDLDPENNGFYDKTPRFLDYPVVLKAFKDEGWTWGGDWDGDGSSEDERQCDGMHWQATLRKDA